MEWHGSPSAGPSLNRKAATCGAAGTSPHGASFLLQPALQNGAWE